MTCSIVTVPPFSDSAKSAASEGERGIRIRACWGVSFDVEATEWSEYVYGSRGFLLDPKKVNGRKASGIARR